MSKIVLTIDGIEVYSNNTSTAQTTDVKEVFTPIVGKQYFYTSFTDHDNFVDENYRQIYKSCNLIEIKTKEKKIYRIVDTVNKKYIEVPTLYYTSVDTKLTTDVKSVVTPEVGKQYFYTPFTDDNFDDEVLDEVLDEDFRHIKSCELTEIKTEEKKIYRIIDTVNHTSIVVPTLYTSTLEAGREGKSRKSRRKSLTRRKVKSY